MKRMMMMIVIIIIIIIISAKQDQVRIFIFKNFALTKSTKFFRLQLLLSDCFSD